KSRSWWAVFMGQVSPESSRDSGRSSPDVGGRCPDRERDRSDYRMPDRYMNPFAGRWIYWASTRPLAHLRTGASFLSREETLIASVAPCLRPLPRDETDPETEGSLTLSPERVRIGGSGINACALRSDDTNGASLSVISYL